MLRFGSAASDLGRGVADGPLTVGRPAALALGLAEVASALGLPDGDPLPLDGLASEPT
jgi:hypothetical protein